MSDWQNVVLIAGGVGLLGGVFVARRSHRAEPVRSRVGHAFHYLASASIVAVPFAVISGLFLRTRQAGFLTALALLALAILMILLHAVAERIYSSTGERAADGLASVAWQRWTTIGEQLGYYNGWLLMHVFYFTLMVPFGIIGRMKDTLHLNSADSQKPSWLPREQQDDVGLEQARRQY